MKKLLGVMIVLVAACGCTSSERAPQESEKVQAIQFVPQPDSDESTSQKR
jgi:hypothetical protein